MIHYYLHHSSCVGLIGPASSEDAAWEELFHKPSSKEDRAAMKEEGWSLRTSLLPRKACGCGWCFVTDDVSTQTESVSEFLTNAGS